MGRCVLVRKLHVVGQSFWHRILSLGYCRCDSDRLVGSGHVACGSVSQAWCGSWMLCVGNFGQAAGSGTLVKQHPVQLWVPLASKGDVVHVWDWSCQTVGSGIGCDEWWGLAAGQENSKADGRYQ